MNKKMINEMSIRLNLGIMAAMEIEDLEVMESSAVLNTINNTKSTIIRLINDLVDALGVSNSDESIHYLKNANQYLRSAEKNMNDITASGSDLTDKLDNLKMNLIHGYATYVLFTQAFISEKIQKIIKHQDVPQEKLDEINGSLTELAEMVKELNIQDKYGELNYEEEKGIIKDMSLLRYSDDDDDEEDEDDDDDYEERDPNAIKLVAWDTTDNLDLSKFREKR